MKILFALAAAFALSVTAAAAQTNPQSTPTPSGGSVSPQSSPPAQAPGSLGTLPSSNTQPASDMTTSPAATAGQTDRSARRTKEMKKPRSKKKMKTSTSTSGAAY